MHLGMIVKRKRPLLLVCLGLLVIYCYQTLTLPFTLEDRFQDLTFLRNVYIDSYRPELWRNVSNDKLLKVFWNTRNARQYGAAALAACTEPARASSDVTGPLNPLDKLLASEPSGQPKARPQDIADYTRAWAWINKTAERRKRYALFGVKMTPEQKARMLFTWRVVHEALTLHNISHFLLAGSLIGAMRHGGIIPWDDDLDIAVDGRDSDKLRRVLSCIPGFTLRLDRALHWKVFPNNAPIRTIYAKSTVVHARILSETEKRNDAIDWRNRFDVVMRFPYVDLFLMNQDDSHLWSLSVRHTGKHLFPLEDVFPLQYVPFDGHYAPVPRQSLQILNKLFEPYECISAGEDHMMEGTASKIYNKIKASLFEYWVSIECSELAPIYRINNVRLKSN